MDFGLARPERPLRDAGTFRQAAIRLRAARLSTPAASSPPGRRWIRLAALLAIACTFAAPVASKGRAATLKPATVEAWNRYYHWADEKNAREVKDLERFLIQDRLSAKELDEIERDLKAGMTVIRRATGVVPPDTDFKVPEGELHHWWGTVLVPGVTMPQLMKFVQDYEHHAGKFADVQESRLISRDGERFVIFYRLMRSKAFVTAYYNTVQQAVYYPVDARHIWSKSNATKIAELENPGTAQEKERPPGDDRGFLWRLASWWRFEQTDDGVIIDIDSASLSRDIPTITKFIPGLSGYIRATPRESMESILLSIRREFASPR
jgi:hypothetical protein